MIKSVTKESLHPLSQLITQYFDQHQGARPVERIQNFVGKGTRAVSDGTEILIGSIAFLKFEGVQVNVDIRGSAVAIAIGGQYKGLFKINHTYREGISSLFIQLKNKGYQMYLLSGDHPTEKQHLEQLLGPDMPMLFEQSPEDKLNFIQGLQLEGKKVMMVGDGLNDAGALQKANVGVAVTDQSHLFTPASDAILEGEQVVKLASLLEYAQKGKLIIIIIFILSIVYNMVGMYFATRAALSPMVAAILMPISSISIVSLSALLTYLFSTPIKPKN
jgi:Cu+-exporting ATPase